MTKIVIATTAMWLVEQGILDLDEPTVRHVASIGRLRPASRAGRITARHLLTHSAGLANPVPVRWIHPADSPGPDPEGLLDDLLARHPRLRFEPGTRSSYSNLGALTLGSAMANLTGKPFVDLVREEILEPLGMARTGFAYTAEMRARAATGYHLRRSPMRLLLPRWVIAEPAGRWICLRRFLLDGPAYGGLVGPVEEVARFTQLHLRDGELDGVRILRPGSGGVDAPDHGPRTALRLGPWLVSTGEPARRRSALRGTPGRRRGVFNVIRIYPSRRVGVAVMGNATRYDIDVVARLAITG
jgi:CubicO group peptidase (beta-lactamase class C family)